MINAERNNGRFEVIDGGRATPLEEARRWTDKGYFVVPIAYREKRPMIDDWQNIRLNVDDLPKHFATIAQNVGLILGEPFGIADVDLDSPEAVHLWQIFAPQTRCVFGHQSKPFSHYLYHMDPPSPSLKFTDPINKATLLELRCLSNDAKVGRQTVIPPSTHKESGEVICFARGLDGAPANVDADLLIHAVRKTSAACVLARHYPPAGGGRHDTELALAGVLCRANWPEADAKSFVLAVYTSVPGHDPKALARVSQSVEDTYRRFSEGGEITGIPKLSALIDKRAVSVALEWLGLDRSHSATVDAGNWQDQLIRTDRGKIIPCVANALIALHAKEWCGVINFNESACRVEALSAPPWSTIKTIPYTWNDEDDVAAAAWMQHHGIMVTKAIVGEAVQTVARNHRFHPIREFFDGLTWDGISRIDDWLTLYLGADPSDYVRAIGAKWLIGAVARVFQPGCKMDCCIVLEGPQGIRKSSALRALAEPWFCDEIADLGSKDSSMQVHGVLVVEIAELDALQKSEVSKVKAFMSRSTDRYRPPYAKYLVEAPRESVFAGSVNPGVKYLKDETGGRRFWPVTCGRIDIESLKRDRNQLWAEAVVRFRANSTWWMDTNALNQAAEQEQAQRYDTDPWLPKIVEYIKDLDSASIRDILEHCLLVPTERWTKGDKNRVAATLRFLGWTDRQAGPRGHREWRYYPPAA